MLDQIDIDNEAVPRPRILKAATKYITLVTAIGGAGMSSYRGACELYREGSEWAYNKKIEIAQSLLPEELKTPEGEALRYRKESDLPLGQLLEQASKDHGINVAVLKAVAEQESGKDSNQLTRYEPKLRAKYGCKQGEEERDCKMRFTSLGVMHIIPYFHAERCNLKSWRDLLSDEVNIHCSGKILRSCYKSTGTLQGMLACYNGSGNDAKNYAATVAGRINGLMIEKRS